MIKRVYALLVLALFFVVTLATTTMAAPPPAGSFIALCYHNVEDSDPDQSFNGVTTSKLIEQLSWLQQQGYVAVSIDDLLAARAGTKPLPEKAMLLTFDDGYESFYTRVYPILRAFHYPAVIGLVDEWMAGKADDTAQPGDTVHYGDVTMPRSAFLTWGQVREMQKSGLVEVASHSHELHNGILANPQGNKEPAAVTAKYDATTQTYESASAYVQRLRADAAASVKTITEKTGKAPRVMVWPYGSFNNAGLMIEHEKGIPITMSLEDGFAKVSQLRSIPRALIKDDPSLGSFVSDIRDYGKVDPIRVVQVDLDYVYDTDPEQEARNLDALITRIYGLKINTVFLQAFSDASASGVASSVYFPNHYLPVREDLFNRVAWQLKTRARVKVYAWLPVLSFDFGDDVAKVQAWNPATKEIAPDPKAYRRVSPFDTEGRKRIIGLYEDLGRNAPIDGLLFHDDAMLSDFEDASPSALEAYKKAGFPDNIGDIRADGDMMARWTIFKTNALIKFTQELTSHVEVYRSPLKTARNIYASLMLSPDSEEWFAQNYDSFLNSYDYTAVEAMPDMENVAPSDQENWLTKLVSIAAQKPDGLKHTVFELQSVDWRKKDKDRAIPTEHLGAQMNLLARHGALSFGYYPDDFIANVPDTVALHKDFSLQTYPYLP